VQHRGHPLGQVRGSPCPLDTASGVRVRKVGPASTIRRILHNVGLVTSEPQTTPLLLPALRGRSAQPVLAVRLRPLGPGRRGRRGDHQLARRPLPLPPRPQRGPRSPAKSPRHPEERQPEPPQTQGKAGRFRQTPARHRQLGDRRAHTVRRGARGHAARPGQSMARHPDRPSLLQGPVR
jgi:hypothetical protein